ncbi:MAG: menaquinone biosynthetic enzyme MqnA/MqnD family protein [Phycisphaerales bacterium]
MKYLNTQPLVEGLGRLRDVEVKQAVPSKLIGMLLAGEVDVALASVVDAAKGGVIALPVGMIGCDGPTLTVRLFSRVPADRIRTIGADTDSHTSVALAQVLLSRRWGVRVNVADFDARERMMMRVAGAARGAEGVADALLLIGDKVVTDPPDAVEYPHQMDLGAAWKEMTGLPFVYAVWMCREGEEDSLAVRTAAVVLDRQRRHNATRLGWLAAERAGERGWPEGLASRYLRDCLRFAVDAPEREAVEKFIAWGAELGVCGAGPVRWAEPLRVARAG